MKNKVRLIAIVLGIPIIAFIVAKGIELKYESEWHSVLVQRFGILTSEQEEFLSLRNICADPERSTKLGEACSIYNQLIMMERGALGAGTLGLSMLVIIALAGHISRSNRKLLLTIFRPGLYLTVFASIILILVNAALAIASIMFGEGALIGRVHGKIILLIGVGALVGVVAIAKASIKIVKKAKAVVVGESLNETTNSVLWKFVADVAKKIGAGPPQHVIVGLTPNFFVTEADVSSVNGQHQGRTMYLSLPLCRILTEDELKAIIGHELGHFKGLDTQFSQKFYPIYKGTIDSLVAVSEHIGEGSWGLALIPAFHILSYFFESFSVAESKISRERELAADRIAAEVAGTQNIATALLKVHAFSGYWDSVLHLMRGTIEQGKQYINISSLFAEVVRVRVNTKHNSLQGLEDQRLTHPTDSHPRLGLRLQTLGLSINNVADKSLQTSPQPQAIELIADYEELEKRLTEVEHLLFIESGQATPKSAQVEQDRSQRKLCSDGNCVGTIDSKGVCSVCGKPYTG